MAKQYSVTYDSYDNWKLPLNLAVGFHLLVAASILFLPGLLKTKPKYEDIYTVNLINFSEPAAEIPAQIPETTIAPEPPPKPLPEEQAVPIIDPVQQPAPAKDVKAVSIKPLKRKIKKKIVKKTAPKINRQKDIEKIKRERLAEALKAEQNAVEQAQIAAEEAARQQKLMEQQLAQIKSQVRSSKPGKSTTNSGSASSKSPLSAQYHNAIMNHVTNYWALPDIKNWDPSLTAVVVITISRNGTISNQFFEKRSGDARFDQFVRKTLQEATPLPPIPAALRKNMIEVGLRFRPGSIQ